MWKFSLVHSSETDSPQEGLRPSLKWESCMRLAKSAGGFCCQRRLGRIDFGGLIEAAGLEDEKRAIGGDGEAVREDTRADRARDSEDGTDRSVAAIAILRDVDADELAVASSHFTDI